MSFLPEWLLQTLVLVTCFNTVLSMHLVKKKRISAWYISLGNQVLWVTINLDKGLWGFLILNVVLTWNAIHAIKLWSGEEGRLRRLAEYTMEKHGGIPTFIKRADPHD